MAFFTTPKYRAFDHVHWFWMETHPALGYFRVRAWSPCLASYFGVQPPPGTLFSLYVPFSIIFPCRHELSLIPEWWFPESQGHPQFSSILDWDILGFSIINQPFWIPPFMKTPNKHGLSLITMSSWVRRPHLLEVRLEKPPKNPPFWGLP